jgi:hypothetical protein
LLSERETNIQLFLELKEVQKDKEEGQVEKLERP